jgi:CheY-like chemotaxis protein
MLKVLVVDDNPDARFLTSRILKQLGCEVTECPGAAAALDKLKQHNPFDVIFTDLYMPGMGGLELLEAVKKHYPDAYLIATSASTHPELQQEAVARGASYCIFQQHTKEAYRVALEQAAATH